MDTIGVVCEPDHPVFGGAAERLAARGFEVEFIPPDDPVPRGSVDELAALANTVLGRDSLALVEHADRTGVETWNGIGVTSSLSSRLVALEALAGVGCRVPETWLSPPETDHVTHRRYRGVGSGTGDDEFYVERVCGDGLTHRYYAVDDGVETHVQTVTVRSRLTGSEARFVETDVDIELATRVREVLDRFGARAIRVDFVRDEDDVFAVDVDPAPTFFGTGMDRTIADSLASLTTIGA